jgi:hypothetical protein
MAIEKDDWRLRRQSAYLQGASWKWQPYRDESSDHAHCEFCWAKFMERPGPDILLEGYVSSDGRCWVCKPCFDDFEKMFAWINIRTSG